MLGDFLVVCDGGGSQSFVVAVRCLVDELEKEEQISALIKYVVFGDSSGSFRVLAVSTSPTSFAAWTFTTASGKNESRKLSSDAAKRLSSSTRTRPGNFRNKDCSTTSEVEYCRLSSTFILR